jgi:ABC-type multidrug transport system fused ATPase/permease subunit
MNETNFNDSNITDDVNNILELTRNLREIFLWVCENLIPIVIIMFIVNGYFLFKYPVVGAINIACNIVNTILSYFSYSKLIDVANIRMEKYIIMVSKLDESFNNMFNAYLNNKIDDAVEANSKIEQDYYDSFLNQMEELEMFSTKLRVNNYFFAFISLYMLFKGYSKKDFINALLIFTFYLSTLEGLTYDVPYIVVLLGNVLRASKQLLKDEKDIASISVRPQYKYKLENFRGNIKIDNISFKYPTISTATDEEPQYVFKDFTLDIPAKSKIAIVARSGSGKTTLMKLLLNFYSPENGKILLDNLDLKDIDPVSVRKNINYINQRTLLIKDTIMNNIKYGNDKTDDEVVQILKKYDLLKIFNPPEKNPESCLQNMVEKGGINISMGMQKVIFLVRGILREGVVFIFDEPLTSIDANTRNSVLNMIKDKTADKTLIIITHDMEVAKIVDNVVDINKLNNKY